MAAASAAATAVAAAESGLPLSVCASLSASSGPGNDYAAVYAELASASSSPFTCGTSSASPGDIFTRLLAEAGPAARLAELVGVPGQAEISKAAGKAALVAAAVLQSTVAASVLPSTSSSATPTDGVPGSGPRLLRSTDADDSTIL
ncbi:unnamed protein product, partial [Protopolystoma xenopodis]